MFIISSILYMLYIKYHIIVDVFDYIKNFTWDDNKFHRGRSLVEIAGLISDVLIFPLKLILCYLENEIN